MQSKRDQVLDPVPHLATEAIAVDDEDQRTAFAAKVFENARHYGIGVCRDRWGLPPISCDRWHQEEDEKSAECVRHLPHTAGACRRSQATPRDLPLTAAKRLVMSGVVVPTARRGGAARPPCANPGPR